MGSIAGEGDVAEGAIVLLLWWCLFVSGSAGFLGGMGFWRGRCVGKKSIGSRSALAKT